MIIIYYLIDRFVTVGFLHFSGYSVAVGHMDGREVYVSGAPREKYLGHVFLLRYANSYLHLAKKLSGEKFGSYFGASVCLADINGDG